MGNLNYHHLLYFWTVAHQGTVSKAAQTLFLSQPTVSEQIRQLEKSLGGDLFERRGKRLVLTSMGQEILRYADDIFALGRELEDFIADRPTGPTLRVQIGIVDRLPKIIAYRIIEPALRLEGRIRVECHDGPLDGLLEQLVNHELDVVLSDSPAPGPARGRIFHHLLGKCDVSFVGTTDHVKSRRKHFPRSLDGAPMLLPTQRSPFRQEIERWSESIGVQFDVRGEFDDSALMKSFGQAGIGIFPVPSAIEDPVKTQYRVQVVGRTADLSERFLAISMDRRIRHPAVQAMTEAARREIFPGR
jgi:LysR family transcriptional activator of nhaA